MNDVMIFEGHQVEVFEWNGQVLFNPYHVGDCLEITPEGVRKAITRMNERQVVKLTNSKVTNSNFRKLHNTGENFLTQSGVFKLIFKSKKEEAEKFQDWVTDEVLPAINKNGYYEAPSQNMAKKQKTLASVNNAAKIILPQLIEAGVDPVQRTYFLKDMYAPVGISVPMLRAEQEKLYEQTEMAEILGLLSKAGKPHAQAIGAILGKIIVREDEVVQTSFSKNGHTDTSNQYKKSVLDKVESWIIENGYPPIIANGVKKFGVIYR